MSIKIQDINRPDFTKTTVRTSVNPLNFTNDTRVKDT